MTHTLKVSMVSLMENDLEAAIAFYTTMGFPMTFKVEKKWAEFDMNGIKLFLYYVDEKLPERYTGLALEVGDLMAFYEDMKTKNIDFINEPKNVDYAIVASIKDPGNNIVGLVQPTPEKVQGMMEAQDDCCGSDEQCCSDEESCC